MFKMYSGLTINIIFFQREHQTPSFFFNHNTKKNYIRKEILFQFKGHNLVTQKIIHGQSYTQVIIKSSKAYQVTYVVIKQTFKLHLKWYVSTLMKTKSSKKVFNLKGKWLILEG